MQPEIAKSKFERNFLIPRHYNLDDFKDLVIDKKKYTYTDYLKLPEGAPYQLIGGSLVMTPAPDVNHQRISGILEFQLRNYVLDKKPGFVFDAPIDVFFGETEVYQPDIIYISNKRQHIIGEKKIEGAPDLIIEILSPSTAYYDLREKYRIYERYDVKEYWIVDPMQKKIEIYENKDQNFSLYNEVEEEGVVSSKLLDGFSVILNDIF